MIYNIKSKIEANTIGELRKALEGLSDAIPLLDRVKVKFLVLRTSKSNIKTKEDLQQATVTHVTISEDLDPDDDDEDEDEDEETDDD